MAELSLKKGADVNRVFRDEWTKTPIESIGFWDSDPDGEPHISHIRLLIEWGANLTGHVPDLAVDHWDTVLHSIIHMDMNWEPKW